MDSDSLPSPPLLSPPDDFPPAEARSLEDAPLDGPSAPPPPRWPDRPWFTIWTAPRGTIRAILEADPTRHVLLLAALAGIATFLNPNLIRHTAWIVLLVALVLGSLGGLLGLYIWGAIFRWTGYLFGGLADSGEIRAAIAWSSVPQITAMVLWLPWLGFYGAEIFSRYAPRETSNSIPADFLAGLQVILGLWSVFLAIKTVAEAHQFSAWYAVAALALPTIVPFMLFYGWAMLCGRGI